MNCSYRVQLKYITSIYTLGLLMLFASTSAVKAQECVSDPALLVKWEFTKTQECNGLVTNKFKHWKADVPLMTGGNQYCPSINEGSGQAMIYERGFGNTNDFKEAMCIAGFWKNGGNKYFTAPGYDENSPDYDPDNLSGNIWVDYQFLPGQAGALSSFNLDFMQSGYKAGNPVTFEKFGVSVYKNGIRVLEETQALTVANMNNPDNPITVNFPNTSDFKTDGSTEVVWNIAFAFVDRNAKKRSGIDNICIFGTAGQAAADIEATPATCESGGVDGELKIVGFSATEKYDFNAGSTYTGTATFATATVIPADGIIANNLPLGTLAEDYSVRIFREDCYIEALVVMPPVFCPYTCDFPTATATPNSATCIAGVQQDDATIVVTGIMNMDRIGISTGKTYTGPDYAGAEDLGGATTYTFDSTDGVAAGTCTEFYTIRYFNGSEDPDLCIADKVVAISAVSCDGCEVICASIETTDSEEVDPNNNLGQATACKTNQVVDIQLTKTVDVSTGTNCNVDGTGTDFEFTILVENIGDLAAQDVTILDIFPDDMVIGSITATAGTILEGYSTISWVIPTLGIGASQTMTVIASFTEPGSYQNCVEVNSVFPSNDPDDTNNTDCAMVTITGQNLPTIEKAFSPEFGRANVPIRLTLKLTNNESSPIALTQDLVDVLPSTPGQMVIAPTPALTTSLPGVLAGAGATEVVVPSGTVLQPGINQIFVDVVAPANGEYANTIAVGDLVTTACSNPAEALAEVNINDENVIAPMITKAFSNDLMSIGQTTTLTVTIENRNPEAMTLTADFVDEMPPGLTVTGTPMSTCGGASLFGETDRVGLTSGTVISGNSNCVLEVEVEATGAGSLCNRIIFNALLVEIDLASGPVSTANEDVSEACLEVSNDPIFDLALRKQLGAGQLDTVITGSTITYDITVFNQGTEEAIDVQITDYIPTELELVLDANWGLSGTNAVLDTPIPSILPGASVTLPIQFTIDPSFNGDFITNFAEISSVANATPDKDSTPDSVSGNDNGGLVESASDDVIFGDSNIPGGAPLDSNGITDEDDADPARVAFMFVAICSAEVTATPGDCVAEEGNYYDLTGTVTFENPPADGNLMISVDGVVVETLQSFSSPQEFTVTGLDSDGMLHTVTTSFSGDETCDASFDYTAPAECFTPEISEPCTTGSMGGMVFFDTDVNGLNDDGTPTIDLSGIQVQIFGCMEDGTSGLIETVLTDENGEYTFTDDSIVDGEEYRIEFSDIPDEYSDTFEGADNSTEVQYVDIISCDVDYGITIPEECAAASDGNPSSNDIRVITTCFVNGDITENVAGEVSDVLIALDFDYGGTNGNSYLASKAEMGSIWSVAYNQTEDVVYAGSILKRHTGMGPEGPGAIYQHDFSNGTNSLFVDLVDLGIDVGVMPTNRGLGEPTQPSYDNGTFTLATKMSLGDIDIDNEDQILYVMNLHDKAVHAIDIVTKTIMETYPTVGPSCTNGEWRPFAVKFYRGELYVGGVCDGSNSGSTSNLEGYIYKLDGGTFTQVLTIPLDYNKGAINLGGSIFNWQPWTDNFDDLMFAGSVSVTHPQPILSDIEFDGDGSMIIGFSDRSGFQLGFANYHEEGNTSLYNNIASGDILIASIDADGVATLESNGSSGGVTTSGANNNEGPGGGEFFVGDQFQNGVDDPHRETILGGVAVLEGSGNVIVSAFDPTDGNNSNFNSGGLIHLSLTTGSKIDGLSKKVYQNVGSNPQTFGKSAGIGDVEVICPPPPPQIGNYAWIDANGDGVQDPCEEPLPGLTVKLYTKPESGDAVLVATSTTSATGEYYFTDNTTAGESWETGFTEVEAGDYYIVFCGDSYDEATGILTADEVTYLTTAPNSGQGSNFDINDSDVSEETIPGLGNLPAICITVDETDFSLDAGFISKPIIEIVDVDISCGPESAGGAIFVTVEGGMGPFTYDWSDDMYDGELTALNVPTGTYTVTVTDGIGCTSEVTTEITIEPCLPNPCTGENLGGTVFNDLDADAMDDGDPENGFAGIKVQIFECNEEGESVLVDEAYTDPNGDYFFSNPYLEDGVDYRVEFSDVPVEYSSTIEGTDNGTEVKYIDVINCDLDYGVIDASLTDAPIQVGNYVWIDTNEDGIQDPCEEPVEDFIVKLYTKPATGDAELAATTMTDENGEYYFTNDTTPGEIWESGFTEVAEGDDYYVVFCGDNYNEETDAITLDNILFSLTNEDTGMGDNPDFNDSDATELLVPGVGEMPVICITADSIDHTLDVGLLPKPDVALTMVVDPDFDDSNITYGDSVKFKIVVYNQSLIDIDSLDIVDYMPTGYTFDEAIVGNEEWTADGSDISTTIPRMIEAGEADSTCIYLTVEPTDDPQNWVNIAEISAAYQGEELIEDCDSPLNTDPMDNGGSEINTEADDETTGDGTAPELDGVAETDQDNVDPAAVDICDLALINIIDELLDNPMLGDTVKFAVIIENQGTVTATNIDIQYTIPDGLTYLPINDDDGTDEPDWTEDAAGADLTIVEDLPLGEMDTVCIYLEIDNLTLMEANEDAYTTFAEISAFEDPEDPGTDKTDIDSTPDDDATDDPGGNPDDDTDDVTDGDGSGDPTDPAEDIDPELDEDDHDPAKIYVCDAAAIIDTEETGPFSYGDTVKFHVELLNQGNGDITNLDLQNLYGEGLSYVENAENIAEGWVLDEEGKLSLLYDTVIPSGELDSICLYMEVLPDYESTEESWLQNLEIVSFEDPENPGDPKQDIDSTPDEDPMNDPGGDPNDSDTDDVTDGDGTGDPADETMDPLLDEDDQDLEDLEICDLALVNMIMNIPMTPNVKDTLKYEVIITNQGNQITNGVNVDYQIPIGLGYLDINDGLTPSWDEVNSGLATVSTEEPIAPGESDTICFYLEIMDLPTADVMDESWVTVAEITSYVDEDDNIKTEDIDSTPDSDPENDPGGNYDDETDNEVTGDGTGDPEDPTEDTDPLLDEDDHDPTNLYICDIAVIIDTEDEGPFKYGDEIKYFVEVHNQGNGEVTNIDLQNLYGEGLEYLDNAENTAAGWMMVSDGLLTTSLNEVLMPGDIDTICLYMEILQDDSIESDSWTQNLEITRFEDPAVPGVAKHDVDSTPDTIADNDPGGNSDDATDDETSGNGTGDPENPVEDTDPVLDEDDQDIELIEIYDVALSKQLEYQDSIYLFGDEIEMNLIIYNQGSVSITNIELTDYVPESLTDVGVIGDNTGWTFSPGLAQYTYTDELVSGQADTVKLFMVFQVASDLEEYINVAEVSKFENLEGVSTDDVPQLIVDADSTPDMDEENDPGGEPSFPGNSTGTDDTVNNENADEDDADPLLLGYVDLALTKMPVERQVLQGEEITFTVKVTNQGTIPSDSIEIVSYYGPDMTVMGDDWTEMEEYMATSVIDIPEDGLQFQECYEHEFTLRINETALPGAYVCYAEIKQNWSPGGGVITDNDIDSRADMVNGDPGGEPEGVTDDSIDGDGSGPIASGLAAQDEDDHDPAAFCVTPQPTFANVDGDFYVCPESVQVLSLSSPYNPDNTYTWTVTGPATILSGQGTQTLEIQCYEANGTNVVVSLNEGTEFAFCSGFVQEAIVIEETIGLSCNNNINVSLDQNCQVMVNADFLLEGQPYPSESFTVQIEDQQGQIIELDENGNAVITAEYIGQTMVATIIHDCFGNSCWGYITLEDKQGPPDFECEDVTVSCIEYANGDLPTLPTVLGDEEEMSTGGFPAAGLDLLAGETIMFDLSSMIPAGSVVTDVDVMIDLTDTGGVGDTDDFDLVITSPSATTGTFMEGLAFWAGTCFNVNSSMNFVLDDEGPVWSACTDLTSGGNFSMDPADGFDALSLFDGNQASGMWMVTMANVFTSDEYIVNNVELIISYQAPITDLQELDNCGISDISFGEVVIDAGDCGETLIERTYLVTDSHGNTNSCTSTITVEPINLADDLGTVLLLPPTTVVLPCGADTDPWSIAAAFDDPTTEDCPNTDSDCPMDIIENNEGISTAFPHYVAWGCNSNCSDKSDEHIQPIDNNVCGVYAIYSDQVVDACGEGCSGNEKVIRTWTLVDWCTQEQATHVQIIKTVDIDAPEITAPDATMSVNPWGCVASGELPTPEHLFDTCSKDIAYTVAGPAGVSVVSVNGDGVAPYAAIGVPKGENLFVYTAIDCCGNTALATMTLTVVDDTPPTAIALENIVVSLTSGGFDEGGTAKVYPSNIDNGSHDGDCGPVGLEIRRPIGAPMCENLGVNGYNNNETFNNNGDPEDNSSDTDGGQYVKFCCDDLAGGETYTAADGQIVTFADSLVIILRVWDDGNCDGIVGNDGDNYNEVWAYARVENKLPPVLVCPPDASIDCNMDWSLHLDGPAPATEQELATLTAPDFGTGIATGAGVCGSISVTYEDRYNEDLCYDRNNEITREWCIEGTNICCDQRIDIVKVGAFDPSTISWESGFPEDEIFLACLGEDPMQEPSWLQAPCDLIAWTVETDTFYIEGNAADFGCIKVINDYTIIDWCAGDEYTFTQVIKVIDDVAPTLEVPEVCIPVVEGCETGVTLCAVAQDMGECESPWLKWEVLVDLYGDWSYDHTFSSYVSPLDPNFDTGVNEYYVPATAPGEQMCITLPTAIPSSKYLHRAIWKVSDGCGNFTSVTETFEVVDKQAPTPYCFSVSSALMDNGEVELWACDFVISAEDNCSDSFTYTFNGPDEGFETPESTPGWIDETGCEGQVFTCPEEGNVISVKVYTWDECNNVNICYVELTLSGCDENDESNRIAGAVGTEFGDMLEDVNISIVSNQPEYPMSMMTDDNGKYESTDHLDIMDYGVSAYKNDDHRNGVSTLDILLIQRHILNLQSLTSPYQYIAADANSDSKITASDLVDIRKLVLEIYDEFPSNTSWRFVDAAQALTTANAFAFNEVIDIIALNSDMVNEDFVASKIGDVNNSVVLSATASEAEARSGNLYMDLTGVETSEGISVEVTSSNFEEIAGYQFTLNTNGLELTGVTPGAIAMTDENVALLDDNIVTVSWSTVTPITVEDEVLFTLNFTGSDVARVSNLEITSEATTAEAYDSDLSILNVVLGDEAEAVFALEQNVPNPFTDNTLIKYTLPTQGGVTLLIKDLKGRLVKKMTRDGLMGENEIMITRNEVGLSGVYTYELQYLNQSLSKKMIVID